MKRFNTPYLGLLLHAVLLLGWQVVGDIRFGYALLALDVGVAGMLTALLFLMHCAGMAPRVTASRPMGAIVTGCLLSGFTAVLYIQNGLVIGVVALCTTASLLRWSELLREKFAA